MWCVSTFRDMLKPPHIPGTPFFLHPAWYETQHGIWSLAAASWIRAAPSRAALECLKFTRNGRNVSFPVMSITPWANMRKSRSTTPPLWAISKVCRKPLVGKKAFIPTSISKQSSTLITIFWNTMQVVLYECHQLKIWHTYDTVIHLFTITMGNCPS